jgi:hypothetical protein
LRALRPFGLGARRILACLRLARPAEMPFPQAW